MNQENYELYNKLSALRNNLQKQFYDYNNSRKPTICTEDSLRLLVKYKPTTIEDMSNISGIGDTFIKNYGRFFLKEIKHFVSTDSVEINDNEKTILSKDQKHLLIYGFLILLLYMDYILKKA